MKRLIFLAVAILVSATIICCKITADTSTSGGWTKYAHNPVLGGKSLGTIFDVSVLKEGKGYKMWCSWRPKKSIALSESQDGFHWSSPVVVLNPDKLSDWESDINRPVVIKRKGLYHMWYTGQSNDRSWIGYATSTDGRTWKRMSKDPVLSADEAWEKTSVMCPDVLWDEQDKIYKMWYSGGEQYEPDAIGYATSFDGLNWKKYTANPIFKNDPSHSWEQAKVTACQVIHQDNEYVMFYIGFHDINYAQIGIARSKNGIDHWQRNPHNPIISPGSGWDSSAVYKPYAIYDKEQDRWLLWYNGRRQSVEQIGVAIHKGKDLRFD